MAETSGPLDQELRAWSRQLEEFRTIDAQRQQVIRVPSSTWLLHNPGLIATDFAGPSHRDRCQIASDSVRPRRPDRKPSGLEEESGGC